MRSSVVQSTASVRLTNEELYGVEPPKNERRLFVLHEDLAPRVASAGLHLDSRAHSSHAERTHPRCGRKKRCRALTYDVLAFFTTYGRQGLGYKIISECPAPFLSECPAPFSLFRCRRSARPPRSSFSPAASKPSSGRALADHQAAVSPVSKPSRNTVGVAWPATNPTSPLVSSTTAP